MMRKFPKENLLSVIASIPEAVYLPVCTGETTEFARYEKGVKPAFDVLNTDKSPKDILFPQWESLMHFRTEGKTISLTEEARSNEDYCIFGVRACDIKAIEVLDRVFLAEPVDTYYAARRAHGTLVAFACSNPEKSCFCGNFGVDPSAPSADVVVYEIGDELYYDVKTEKGERLAAYFGGVDADGAAVEEEKANIAERLAKQPYAELDLARFKPENLMELFESDKWKKLSMPCLGCGTCTFVCPTCQCYDIRDYETKDGIQRYRCWDSCMYSDFTLMAHGQSRHTQVERYRQRFMHKLVYYPSKNDGMYSCVGCGRCIKKCPMNLNIVKVIKTLGKEGNEK